MVARHAQGRGPGCRLPTLTRLRHMGLVKPVIKFSARSCPRRNTNTEKVYCVRVLLLAVVADKARAASLTPRAGQLAGLRRDRETKRAVTGPRVSSIVAS